MFTKLKKIFQLSGLFLRIFTRPSFSKVLIIFTVGLISRITVGYYYDVNVFLEYYKAISFIYYSFMAIFVVVLGELFNYFNSNITPKITTKETILKMSLRTKDISVKVFYQKK